MIWKLFKLSLERFSAGHPPTRVGQKVTLSDAMPLAPSEEFPIEGTSYECGGVVHVMNRRKNAATVDWYNGRMVNVRLDHLKSLSSIDYHDLRGRGFVSDNPNFTFKSIKQNRKKSWNKTGSKEDVQYFQDHYTMGSNITFEGEEM